VQGTAADTRRPVGHERQATEAAGRKRAAVELIARDGGQLKRTARRYSLCPEDAEDAYQRGLEILLTKAPTDKPRELLAWTTTVIKHEALAVRRDRERLLGRPSVTLRGGEEAGAWLARLPTPSAGPSERLERSEEIARSREAIRALKPAERRALTLLAAGYSYAEIGEITGFSQTKINRCLAEGRERFRRIVASSEEGSRCAEMRPLLSAFCDGEAESAQIATVREHLRACSGCRATVRAYRAAPATVAALCPLPLGLAATGAKGGWPAAFGKLVGAKQIAATCVIAGTAAGVASGIVPVPEHPADRAMTPQIERVGERLQSETETRSPKRPERSKEKPAARASVATPPPQPVTEAVPVPSPEPVEVPAEPVEAPTQPVNPAPPPAAAPSGSAAGEFGP
jgi:RNA polymerase sigma factor (sigma-70 family)